MIGEVSLRNSKERSPARFWSYPFFAFAVLTAAGFTSAGCHDDGRVEFGALVATLVTTATLAALLHSHLTHRMTLERADLYVFPDSKVQRSAPALTRWAKANYAPVWHSKYVVLRHRDHAILGAPSTK
jgi:hypothetical protein